MLHVVQKSEKKNNNNSFLKELPIDHH